MDTIVPLHDHLMKDIAISLVREHPFRVGCRRARRAEENITAERKGRGPRRHNTEKLETVFLGAAYFFLMANLLSPTGG